MGEEKQQGENRAGNGSAQGRRPVSGRSSIYGSKESQQMMKRSAQHSAQARSKPRAHARSSTRTVTTVMSSLTP